MRSASGETRCEAIDADLPAQWKSTFTQPREDGVAVQSWLWAAPAKHSTRQIDRVLERIELLTSLKVDRHLAELPDAIVCRYARRLASRAPSVAARIAERTRTIEAACFLRYSLMINTDHLLWMVRRRVADLWRKAPEEADAQTMNYEPPVSTRGRQCLKARDLRRPCRQLPSQATR
jgi:hypothetical protein